MPRSMPLTVEISLSESITVNDDVPELQLFRQWATAAYSNTVNNRQAVQLPGQHALTDEPLPASVNVYIAGTEEIQQLNYQFRDKDQPTNVLSFPMQLMDEVVIDEMNMTMLGDIALCATVIKQEAQAQGKSIESHWAHMVIHGMLHLQGFDHTEQAQAEAMEQLEITLLDQLGFANPYQ